MTNIKDPALETALVDTVETELRLMQSFCEPEFPCDSSTTVAMRMSRAVVSAVARLSEEKRDALDDQGEALPLLSTSTVEALSEARLQLRHLNTTYEAKLAQLHNDHEARHCWQF